MLQASAVRVCKYTYTIYKPGKGWYGYRSLTLTHKQHMTLFVCLHKGNINERKKLPMCGHRNWLKCLKLTIFLSHFWFIFDFFLLNRRPHVPLKDTGTAAWKTPDMEVAYLDNTSQCWRKYLIYCLWLILFHTFAEKTALKNRCLPPIWAHLMETMCRGSYSFQSVFAPRRPLSPHAAAWVYWRTARNPNTPSSN